MGISGGPDIINDSSLVLALDASDRNSYVSGSTTWFDVSGNNNSGSLTNGPTFSSAEGGSIVFDGTNDYATTNYTGQLLDFTACVWFKSTSPTKPYERLVDKSYQNGFWIGRNSSNPNSWGGGVRESASPYGRYITLNDNQWHLIVSIRSGTTHTIYGDGITNSVSGTVSGTALDSTAFYIGVENPLFNTYLRGNIASVQIYNRALSASEILQNYNALKSRFNL